LKYRAIIYNFVNGVSAGRLTCPTSDFGKRHGKNGSSP